MPSCTIWLLDRYFKKYLRTFSLHTAVQVNHNCVRGTQSTDDNLDGSLKSLYEVSYNTDCEFRHLKSAQCKSPTKVLLYARYDIFTAFFVNSETMDRGSR